MAVSPAFPALPPVTFVAALGGLHFVPPTWVTSPRGAEGEPQEVYYSPRAAPEIMSWILLGAVVDLQNLMHTGGQQGTWPEKIFPDTIREMGYLET